VRERAILEYGRTLFAGGLYAGILLSAIGMSVSVFADEEVENPPSNSQGHVPDFSLPAISDRNKTITLSAYRGKTVYLDFWSSWCAPCRESLPLLSELHDQLAGDDFAIVAVNLDAHPADGRRLMEQYAIKYPVASDITGIAADKFGLSTLPAAYLINDEGVVQPELPQMNEQNIAAIKTSLLELIDAY
jgi:thiol-disulfide isomerase/thioredoxin